MKTYVCKLCGGRSGFEPHIEYHAMGVCGNCVRRLANSYSYAHSGAPAFDFCTDAEWNSYIATLSPNKSGRRANNQPRWRRLRLEVAARDGFVCHYCKKDVGVSQFTVDHIIPVSRGGKDELDNLVGCCKSCNSRKGVKEYKQFADRHA